MKRIILLLLLLTNYSIASNASKSITLNQCIEIGIKNNIDIQKTSIDEKIAKANIQETDAMFEPMLKAELGYSELKYSTNTLSIDSFSFGISKKLKGTGAGMSLDFSAKKDDSMTLYNPFYPAYSSDIALSYSQPILKNGLGKNDRRISKIAITNLNISELTNKLQKQMITNQIEKAYFDLEFSVKNLNTQKSSLKRAKKLLRINKQKFKDGLIEEVDVIATEAALKVREASIFLAEDMLSNSVDNLKKIVGLDVDEQYLFSSVTKYKNYKLIDKLDSQAVIEQALKNRIDKIIVERLIALKRVQSSLKKNELLPALDMVGRISKMGIGNGWDSTYKNMPFVWYVGINLNVLPFNKRSKSLYKKSDYDFKKQKLDLKDKENDIIRECNMITRQVNTQIKYIKAAEAAFKLQKKKLELEQKKFEQGRSSIQWLLTFQDDLNNAEITLYQALTNYNKALTDLEFITGRK